ncbi:MAG TPA: primosomal protein N' [Bacteroidales bacterium]|nr:primosomal protein N' [Bacteroidales bacterium]HSA42899.1 primosomal protein N' [Bacteroidales bacterium]
MKSYAGTYVDVLLPLPLPGTFCYAVPEELTDQVEAGKRVEVQFGRNRVLSGLVKHIHHQEPQGMIVKSILSVIDERPVVTEIQLRFWDWMATYYMCHPGEVMNVAFPSGMKLSSESRITLNPAYRGDSSGLSDREYLIYEALQLREEISMKDAAAILQLKKVMPVIRSLVEKGMAFVYEDLQDKYIPRREHFVMLHSAYQDEEMLHQLFDQLEKKSEKQLNLLMHFLQMSRSNQQAKLRQSALLKESGMTHAVVRAMEKKGIFLVTEEIVSRLGDFPETDTPGSILLNPYQEVALKHTESLFTEKEVVLLHGVTSSGKTEIYIKLIAEVLQQGKQVLYLLPEIALTTHIINRLRKYFGNVTGVYHSRYNSHERVEIWRQVLMQSEREQKYAVILGARSALFLPFSRLGLIIVDEEHDSSYKQQDPAPRYLARDAAIMLGRLHGAKVLLGSASPSVESCYNALQGRYGMVRLNERYGGLQMPEVQVIDMNEARKQKNLHSHYSQVLLDQIGQALARQEQVILFQNRRGFSLRLVCEQCQWSPECIHCDVTLTYHKFRNELRCHYCGYSTRLVSQCPSCGGSSIRMSGFGTEKVEEELPLFFPSVKIARMDQDSTRSRFSHQKLLHAFESGEIDMLVGTQMVTKGLDFENVSLVGILNADNQFTYPDFRSFERAYQLMTQVGGRSGRRSGRGKVLIQTWSPAHPVIGWILRNDYAGMYQHQTNERAQFRYPPFYRLIQLTLKHKDQKTLLKAARQLGDTLRKPLGMRVIGPEYPLVSRINQYYIQQLLVKIERDGALTQIKSLIAGEMMKLEQEKSFGSLKIQVDVDPY